MTCAFLRAAAFAVAAMLPFAIPAHTALGQGARVETAQDNPELKKRADALFKGVGESGGTVRWGALEAGTGPESLVVRQIEIVSKDKKKVTIDEIAITAFDWSNPREPRHADMAMKKFVVAADQLDAESAANFRELGLSSTANWRSSSTRRRRRSTSRSCSSTSSRWASSACGSS
jgi:hypothetical protein